MPRPLMQLGVGQLEELFAKSKADQTVLKQLEHELQYRQVPRAVALLAEVQAVMYGERTSSPSAPERSAPPAPTTTVRQPDLWDRPAQPPAPAPAAATTAVSTSTPMRPPPAPAAVKPAAPHMPTVPLEDAYKLLKATAGSTWESIEQTRRALIQQSHPERLKGMSADKRSQALEEAKRVNAAYAALSRARCAER